MKKSFPPTPATSAARVSRRRQRPGQRGFSLVEVTLALGVMAFCIIPVFGLLPVGINSNQTALNQTRAASVAANVCADVRGTLLTATASPRFGVAVGNAGATTLYFSEAGDAIAQPAAAYYRAVVTMTPGVSPAATWMNVAVTWPAAVAPNPAGKYLITTAVNRN